MNFLGFEIKRLKDDSKENQSKSFAPPNLDDGAEIIDVPSGVGSIVHGINFETSFKNIEDQIDTYTAIAEIPEVADGIDDIVNEAIVMDGKNDVVTLDLDNVDLSDNIKKKIGESFKTVLSLLNFNKEADKLFRKWYITGRQYYHIITNDSQTEVLELRWLDPKKIKKIRNVKKSIRDGVEYIDDIEEYYTYKQDTAIGEAILRISPEAILEVTSGIVDTDGNILSHIHRAIKPANQLKELEDSLVIHRVARSPQRRVFYVDVGKLPRTTAEKYLNSVISRFKNKISYNTRTGEIRSEAAHHSMLEDIFLPRKEGSRGTEVSTLEGANNLGDIEDVLYFRKRLYKALHIPVSRLEQETAFSLGRANEITRDELKFTKFITNLRNTYSKLLKDALEVVLVTEKVMTREEWDAISNFVGFVWNSDSQFSELKELEILGERLSALSSAQDYVGKYFSMKFIRKNILRMTDEEIENIMKEIEEEKKSGELEQDDDRGF